MDPKEDRKRPVVVIAVRHCSVRSLSLRPFEIFNLRTLFVEVKIASVSSSVMNCRINGADVNLTINHIGQDFQAISGDPKQS